MPDPYLALLSDWCDALVRLQVRTIDTPGLLGGILCPQCARIHGRSADAVYPLVALAHRTGDERYLAAARLLQRWSDHVSCADGSWVNEPSGNEWRGISVFSALALLETLRHHRDVLDPGERDRWTHRLERGVAYIDRHAEDLRRANINYPIVGATVLTLAGQYFGRDDYVSRGKEVLSSVLPCFTESGLLAGEAGVPWGRRSRRGCACVDLAYNVEESLPALVLLLRAVDDAVLRDIVVRSLHAHLELMLPDGAWDDSWGTRNYKWTYWGSRTSDGCQAAYALMADVDPVFGVAALRNLRLLAECTHDGILRGGPHEHASGLVPCIHHTFCHAKALATVLDHASATSASDVPLPRETLRGARALPEIATWLVHVGPWHATVTASDAQYQPGGHPSGGALSVLWHETVGLVLCSSPTEYTLYEPSNMPAERERSFAVLTPTLVADVRYSCADPDADVAVVEVADGVDVRVTGTLCDAGGTSGGPDLAFEMVYRFRPEHVGISARMLGSPPSRVRLSLPLVSCPGERCTGLGSERVTIAKPGGSVVVVANATLASEPAVRMYSPVPSLEAVALSCACKGLPIDVIIQVEP